MKKVIIQPGCISCGSCQFICPQVFEVTDRSRVLPDGDLLQQADKIKEAALKCPVKVIIYEE
ncbi:MAG TPA: ferredoxin [Patescibacteria group bacterium]|jgi:ferredoxin|nr:ferredoxin [Patescibacteria group bacterium]